VDARTEIKFTEYRDTVVWQDTPLSREIELRLSPTKLTQSGFALEGALCLRSQSRFAVVADLLPTADEPAQRAARSRLQLVVATATRAVCAHQVRVFVDPVGLRFYIDSGDPPHPAADAQIRLRIERGLGAWLRERWLRRE
jgi:hypothetical protein